MNNAEFSYMVNQFKERNRGVWDNTLKRKGVIKNGRQKNTDRARTF